MLKVLFDKWRKSVAYKYGSFNSDWRKSFLESTRNVSIMMNTLQFKERYWIGWKIPIWWASSAWHWGSRENYFHNKCHKYAVHVNGPNSLFFVNACPKLILPLRCTMNLSAEDSITVLPKQNHVWNGIFGWMRWLLHVCEMGICWIATFLLFGRVIRSYIE